MYVLIIPLTFIIFPFIYFKIYKPLQYWSKKGVPYLKPWPIFGNMGLTVLRLKSFTHILDDAYRKFSHSRYFGSYLFSKPSIVIRDIDLIKQICIKDFDKFTDRPDFLPEKADPFWKKGLVARTGKEWHDMRVLLSPAFTSSKMKMMFSLMIDCAEEFVSHFQKESDVITLEMRDTFSRYTNDVIASYVFGIKCNSLKVKNNDFFLMAQEAFDFSGLRGLTFFGCAISPTLMNLFKVTMFSEKIKNFFRQIVSESIKHREETGLIRPDMIHLLREAQKGRLKHEVKNGISDSGFAEVEESDIGRSVSCQNTEITVEDITIQAVIFYFGGFDTTSALLCHMAYELAINPDIQDRLIEEIDTARIDSKGKITYESLLGMKYLDMVTSETLRLWSPANFISRLSVKPFTIDPVLPNENPVHLPPGTDITLPIYSIHRDPDHFPNPNKFDPERFSDENKHNIKPYTYLPFGIGPRNCIGNRFALLQTKTLMFFLLSRFNIVPVEKSEIPFVMSTTDFTLDSDNGYWFGLKPRAEVTCSSPYIIL